MRRSSAPRVGPQRLIEITGNDALTGFTAPKLVWVRDHEPETWRRVAHVLLPKDYVRLRLTGEHAIDKADGPGTLLFDLAARDWSPEVLDALEIDPAWMPPTFEGPEVTGSVTEAAAAATGLRAGHPGRRRRRRPGGERGRRRRGRRRASSRCRSGRRGSSSPRPTGRWSSRAAGSTPSATRCPDRWHLMSVMLSAAGSLRWFRDALAPGTEFADLVAAAAEVPAGSDGLWFLPYLTGERSPHPDPLARGAFIGLTVAHDRRHLTRAVLEGVAYGLRDGLDLMTAAGMPAPAQIRASGGGTASPLWRQILADVLGAEIATVATTEGAAYGAALLAAVGAGWYASVGEATEALVTRDARREPRPRRDRYADAPRACTGSCTRPRRRSIPGWADARRVRSSALRAPRG